MLKLLKLNRDNSGSVSKMCKLIFIKQIDKEKHTKNNELKGEERKAKPESCEQAWLSEAHGG